MRESNTSTATDLRSNPVILFDGVCNFCNSSVNFIIDRDKNMIFRFASLQSEAGQQLLMEAGAGMEEFDSVVLVYEGRIHIKSSAAIKIASMLPFPWPIVSVFRIIPARLRDFVYDYIARNRYKWFGKRDACRIPDAETRARFIE